MLRSHSCPRKWSARPTKRFFACVCVRANDFGLGINPLCTKPLVCSVSFFWQPGVGFTALGFWGFWALRSEGFRVSSLMLGFSRQLYFANFTVCMVACSWLCPGYFLVPFVAHFWRLISSEGRMVCRSRGVLSTLRYYFMHAVIFQP